MGYESILTLVGTKIKPEYLAKVEQTLEKKTARGFSPINWYFDLVMIDEDDCLAFIARKDGADFYDPFEDGSVPAIMGKWPDVEKFASWLRQYSEKGGRMVLHSIEGDGVAFGWEFDGNGRMRYLELRPAGKWD